MIGFFNLCVIAFVWSSVKKTTEKDTKYESTQKYLNTVHAKIIELYGVERVVNGITIKELPPEFKDVVNEFITR